MTTRYSLTRLSIVLFVLLPISVDPRGGVLLAEDEAGKEKVVRRSIPLEDDYLLIPIQNGAPSIAIDFEIDGMPTRQFDCELAPRAEDADFWAFLDLTPFGDKTATLRAKGATESQLAAIRQADSVPGSDTFYREPLRPQFHFSQKLGWNNDPNGMVYHDGKWHLYFQHNPYGWKWGNMHWGHAVSDDLVHWQQLPIAIYNKARGDYAFSGGAVVDEKNTVGSKETSHRSSPAGPAQAAVNASPIATMAVAPSPNTRETRSSNTRAEILKSSGTQRPDIGSWRFTMNQKKRAVPLRFIVRPI
jgi:hypothetical protein